MSKFQSPMQPYRSKCRTTKQSDIAYASWWCGHEMRWESWLNMRYLDLVRCFLLVFGVCRLEEGCCGRKGRESEAKVAWKWVMFGHGCGWRGYYEVLPHDWRGQAYSSSYLAYSTLLFPSLVCTRLDSTTSRLKYVCHFVRYLRSPTSTDCIYTTKLVLN